jgi:hypothetical protein
LVEVNEAEFTAPGLSSERGEMRIEKTNMKLAVFIISAMFEIEPQKDIPVLFRNARYRTSEGS